VVRGLDALDGTPILDLKIYIPEYDSFPQAVVPVDWCRPTAPRTASRLMHWTTTNVAVSLGMRAGLAALAALGIRRGGATRAKATGPLFFAQGVEAVTGAGPLDGTLLVVTGDAPPSGWSLELAAGGRTATVRPAGTPWSGADAVLAASAEELFGTIEVTA
jgi:tRNA (adenine37-N6)-methyltransferase